MDTAVGGIRCVKINAYLEQVLGFTNSSRLEGGIISYTRELEKLNSQRDSSSFREDSRVDDLVDREAVLEEGNVEMISSSQLDTSESKPIHLSRNVKISKFKG